MSNLCDGAPSDATPSQQPAPTPTSSQGFFTSLLSPLYSSPPPRTTGMSGVDGPTRPAGSSPEGGFLFGSGRSPTTTTTTTTATDTPLPLDRTHLSRSSSSHSQHNGISGQVTQARPAPQQQQQQKPGYVMQLFGFTDTTVANGSGGSGGSGGGGVAVPSSSAANPFPGRTPHSKASASHPASKRPSASAAPSPAVVDEPGRVLAADNSSASQQQQQRGLCAPQMLGYRQCLEVNPDSKANCTWALDSYMQCQEDAQL
ncbi:hypothetical protein NESM_000276500 [Novymonas esmeraldas]|uniref:CHCH domain-containing protein n=1 Tax=Novymonas esmeraldas TaxID=1808958 RepID=A0AAW0F730_9TRYP